LFPHVFVFVFAATTADVAADFGLVFCAWIFHVALFCYSLVALALFFAVLFIAMLGIGDFLWMGFVPTIIDLDARVSAFDITFVLADGQGVATALMFI
jgi:hypothetical protein